MQIKSFLLGAVCAAAFAAMPAMAQDAEPAAEEASSPVTVTGGVTLTSDYRFRGLTQTGEDPAVQGTVTVAHESGLYAGVWASTIEGDGAVPALAGYGDVEIDLYAGFAKSFDNGLGIDVGLLYYWYADGENEIAGVDYNTDFFEPYAKLNYALGPVSTTVGVAYAWGGQSGLEFAGNDDENIYVFGDLAAGIPGKPVTLKGHLGYTDGALGFNPRSDGSIRDHYWDWAITAEAKGGPFTVGVSYVDTNITETRAGGTFPDGFAQEAGNGSTVLAYIGASF